MMLKLSFVLACVCGFVLTAETQTFESGSITSTTNGSAVKVQYSTVSEPPLKRGGRLAFGGGFSFDAKSIHRWMLNKGEHTYFGYDLIVEPAAGSGCRVTILPLSLSADEIRRTERGPEIDSSWKSMDLPSYPDPQIAQADQSVALDLMATPDGKQKITDYLQTACNLQVPTAATDSGPARDFTVDDMELNVSAGSLYVNGGSVGGTPVVGDANGAVIWFYFPGKGRFLVSIAPHNGYNFQRAGTVKRNIIAFDFAGDHYEVRASHPIASERAIFNAYVMFDGTYQPKGSNAAFGSAESVDSALAQR
jgi:hypothetical protein